MRKLDNLYFLTRTKMPDMLCLVRWTYNMFKKRNVDLVCDIAELMSLAEEGQGPDREGYRMEFLQLVRQARALNDSASNAAPPAGQIKSRP